MHVRDCIAASAGLANRSTLHRQGLKRPTSALPEELPADFLARLRARNQSLPRTLTTSCRKRLSRVLQAAAIGKMALWPPTWTGILRFPVERPWEQVTAGSYLRFPRADVRKRFLAAFKPRLRYQDKLSLPFSPPDGRSARGKGRDSRLVSRVS